MKDLGRNSDKDNVLQGIEEHYGQIISSIESAYALDGQTAANLYMHMWIYTHGIAVLIATGVCRFKPAQVSEMLSQVCIALIKKIKTEGSL